MRGAFNQYLPAPSPPGQSAFGVPAVGDRDAPPQTMPPTKDASGFLSALNVADLGLTNFVGLEGYSHLEVLDARRNRLVHFYGLPTLPSLRYFHVDENHITSFLGMSHQPSLEMITLENNPICDHPKFRLLALLACGENLKVINHTPVTTNERRLVQKLGGPGGWAARLVSFGWVDIQLEDLPDAVYQQLFDGLKTVYFHVARDVDRANSFGVLITERAGRSIEAAHIPPRIGNSMTTESAMASRGQPRFEGMGRPPFHANDATVYPEHQRSNYLAPGAAASVEHISQRSHNENYVPRGDDDDHQREHGGGEVEYEGGDFDVRDPRVPPLNPSRRRDNPDQTPGDQYRPPVSPVGTATDMLQAMLPGSHVHVGISQLQTLYAASGMPRDFRSRQVTVNGNGAPIRSPNRETSPGDPFGTFSELPELASKRPLDARTLSAPGVAVPTQLAALDAARRYAKQFRLTGSIAGAQAAYVSAASTGLNGAGSSGLAGRASSSSSPRGSFGIRDRFALQHIDTREAATSPPRGATSPLNPNRGHHAPAVILLQSEVGCLNGVEIDNIDVEIDYQGKSFIYGAMGRVAGNGTVAIYEATSLVFSFDLPVALDLQLDTRTGTVVVILPAPPVASASGSQVNQGGGDDVIGHAAADRPNLIITVTPRTQATTQGPENGDANADATDWSPRSTGAAAVTARLPAARGLYKLLMLFRCTPEELDSFYAATMMRQA